MEMRKLSPLRNTTTANNSQELAAEQLHHFGIDAKTDFGQSLQHISEKLYDCASDLDRLWVTTLQAANSLDRKDRIAYFNALKFLSFQLAKLLDIAQAPARKTYQALGYDASTQCAKGPYPVFDNVTAIFSANPVIARTATYIYACAEWIADAFEGKELLLEIYSRLLNPTSVALANHMVDLEAGAYASEYFAWNFNSGMAAIDTVLAHVLGREDILITSRNIYGGAHQLIHDWYAKPSNLAIHVDTFDGSGADDFLASWQRVAKEQSARLAAGRKAYVYLESPCNPHGYVLDIPAICREAHKLGLRVILDATVSTPFLVRPLQRENPDERPDFIIHSYTKDLSGTGSVIAGVVIGRNEDMFIPKGQSAKGIEWNETLFWNVYYVKGAFLNADAAFEVMQGIRTLEVRMLSKCVNTLILAKFLGAHPAIRVHCNALPQNSNYELGQKLLHLGLPAPLFTIDFDAAKNPISRETFKRFFDNLSPTFGHMISLGQSNTIVACPGLTTHSELSLEAQAQAGISTTTIRFAVGDENPHDLLSHLIHAARLSIDPDMPEFSKGFPTAAQANALIQSCYMEAHSTYIKSQTPLDY
jgi:cystathionine beta-lyase/cystathionine gamma-synthase